LHSPWQWQEVYSGVDLIAQKQNKCIWHITKLNFKKPRTDCQRGFGLCIKEHMHYMITDFNGGECEFAIWIGGEEPHVEKNEVFAGVAISKNKLRLALPKEIMELEEYKNEDLSFLPIEEKIVLYVNKKPFRVIRPQKALMKEEGGYLVYDLELTD
jgi:hypothetical protein